MLRILGAVLLALVGCSTDEAAGGDDTGGGGGEADGESCTDPTYGDRACGIPGIDCFRTDAEAGAWLTGVWHAAGCRGRRGEHRV
jgi:hypothetical protein